MHFLIQGPEFGMTALVFLVIGRFVQAPICLFRSTNNWQQKGHFRWTSFSCWSNRLLLRVLKMHLGQWNSPDRSCILLIRNTQRIVRIETFTLRTWLWEEWEKQWRTYHDMFRDGPRTAEKFIAMRTMSLIGSRRIPVDVIRLLPSTITRISGCSARGIILRLARKTRNSSRWEILCHNICLRKRT